MAARVTALHIDRRLHPLVLTRIAIPGDYFGRHSAAADRRCAVVCAEMIKRDTVIQVARLARLELAETEIDAFTAELGAVIEHFNQLSEIDVSAVTPAASLVAHAPLRADARQPHLDHASALDGAARIKDGGFAVPGFVSDS